MSVCILNNFAHNSNLHFHLHSYERMHTTRSVIYVMQILKKVSVPVLQLGSFCFQQKNHHISCKVELQLVKDRYGNFHLTDTDMLIITDADTDKKKTNSPIPIRRKGIHRYRC